MRSVLIFVFIVFCTFSLAAQSVRTGKTGIADRISVAGSPSGTIININNLATWYLSNGKSNISPLGSNGTLFPRHTGNVVYVDGLVWGGKAYLNGFEGGGGTQPWDNHIVRVGGSTYSVGTRAGSVSGSGATAAAANTSDPAVRIYRIRRDYYTLKTISSYSTELKIDAADFNETDSASVTNGQMDAVYAQYGTDWSEWPVQFGAPFIDRNGNGMYDPPPAFGPNFTVDSLISGSYDEPGIAGADPTRPADEVVWTVYNDLNEATATGAFSSEPLGLEVQKTVWAYKDMSGYPLLNNVQFIRYRFTNKGGVKIDNGGSLGSWHIDSLFIGQWADTDIGSFSDDLVGCDSALAMGFAYNGSTTDPVFTPFTLAPPAVGYQILSGPVVPAPGDTAAFDFHQLVDYRNVSMSSFAYFNGSTYTEPPNGVTAGYSGTTGQWWKVLRGFAPIGTMADADVLYDHGPYPATRFPLSGDAVGASGFIDGLGQTYSAVKGDRRIFMSVGPVQLGPGSVQDLVISYAAGSSGDRFSSITSMKQAQSQARSYYQTMQGTAVLTSVKEPSQLPGSYKLFQNYPNPFNPSTDIMYQTSQTGHVRIAVYDLLGRVVARLVDRILPAGEHHVQWNASTVPSGVYFYRLEAGGFVQVRKMVVTK